MPRPQPQACAHTQGPHRPGHRPDPKLPASTQHALFEVSDAVEHLNDSHAAFEALEGLVTPVGAYDNEALQVSRSQLGALLRILNRDARERLANTRGQIEAARNPS